MPVAETAQPKPIRVFAQLAHGFGAAKWQAKWERGEIIGLNERRPYGLFWADEQGCVVEYSEDRAEGPIGVTFRLGVRWLLGFDLVHAWRNRRGIYAADIVWTGTESQYLAVLLLLRPRGRKRRPKVVAQTIWLFDRWPRLPALWRALYRSLIADAAVLTMHSMAGLKAARAFFPRQRALFMPYGIAADNIVPPRRRSARDTIRVLSAGHDGDRDWATLVAAVRDRPQFELLLVVRRPLAGLQLGCNVSVVHPATNDDYLALYHWADVVALSLRPNSHGSDITVIEEAVLLGVPVVATDTGGLRGYFSDEEVRYVAGSDPDAMREAIKAIAEDEGSTEMAERAQRRMIDAGFTSRGFARRHALLSRELLAATPKPGAGQRLEARAPMPPNPPVKEGRD